MTLPLSSVSERLNALRVCMKHHDFSAFIVTNYDPHHSEYSAEHWFSRQWITGFTGSSGDAVITQNGGGLWTDGRYYIQATEQLAGTGIDLFKARLTDTPTIPQWLEQTLPNGSKIGVDGRTISHEFLTQLTSACSKKQIEVVLIHDLIGEVWSDRPSRPQQPVFEHATQYAGESVSSKLSRIRQSMREDNIQHHLIATLDDIMWTLNIRGGDSPYCPVSESYLLISDSLVTLFIAQAKLPASIKQNLLSIGIDSRPYEEIEKALSNLQDNESLRYCPTHTDSLLISALNTLIDTVEGPTYAALMKSIKNPIELENMEHTLCLDGSAVVKFSHWLTENVDTNSVCELSAEQQLMSYRKELPGYISESFHTIAGYAEHGAKMHYAATEESNKQVESNNFFLVDSGAHYPGGTTDITRTFHFGKISESQSRDYTLVLKSVIRLTQARFLKGTRGCNLDILARGVLWQHGIDYKCGTGHGVGMCLNVHEGPQSFSQALIDQPLEPCMVITNEPGIYRDGQYGIRIENIMKVVELEETDFGQFYGFETITLAPIQTTAIITSMLELGEKEWLNNYHKTVFEKLSPHLDDEHIQWLAQATLAI
ncbi:MAG: aminopeptidase P family protein [Aliivibrio sp.]|uniref:aminopeptidase P family protein n=1 Tax=Aliivibrio sp. TaxID=1872443 RepID=UPI001A608EDC|nr:aminopeptidase P family protein [Aliivibrio sp.]